MTTVPLTAPRKPSLEPAGGSVHIVRWRRLDNHSCRHRIYRTLPHAECFADRLLERGFDVAIYTSPVAWTEHTS